MKANVAEAEAEIREAKAKVAEAEAEIRDAKDEIREAKAKVTEAEAKVDEAKAKVTEAEAKVDEAKAKVKENSADEYWIKELQDREGTLKRREEALKTANETLKLREETLKRREETLKRREEFFFAVRKSFIGASGIRFVFDFFPLLFNIFSCFYNLDFPTFLISLFIVAANISLHTSQQLSISRQYQFIQESSCHFSDLICYKWQPIITALSDMRQTSFPE